MMYLFHNVYGDADDLIASRLEDVECVKFGWSPEVEEHRNQLLAQLGVQVSVLPSLVFDRDGEWQVLAVGNLPQPWSWDAILAKVEALAAASS